MHLVDDKSASWVLYFLLLHRAEEIQPGRNQSTVAIFGFQLGLYHHVVVPLSSHKQRLSFCPAWPSQNYVLLDTNRGCT